MAAAGSPQLVKGSWLKAGAVVIDVGTNAVADESKKSGTRWFVCIKKGLVMLILRVLFAWHQQLLLVVYI